MVKSDGNNSRVEEEPLDPRIKHELERLNWSVDMINKLENLINATQSRLLSYYNESHSRLSKQAIKLGRCIGRSKPYYDARIKLKEANERLDYSTSNHDRAESVLSAARELMDVAEEQLGEQKALTPEWQEVLNATNEKVCKADEELIICTTSLESAQRQHTEVKSLVKKEYKLNKKSIHKSKPYYEAMAECNTVLESHQEHLNKKKAELMAAKSCYSQSLKNLEKISEDIHSKRQSGATSPVSQLPESGIDSEDNSDCDSDVTETDLDSGFSGLFTGSDGSLCASDDSLGTLSSESELTSTPIQKGKEKQMLRERSKSCEAAPDQSDKQTAVAAERTKFELERSASLPHALQDVSSDSMDACQLSGSDSGSSVSVLDDSCLNSAVSYQNFNALSICPQNEEDLSALEFSASDNKYDTLPSKLKRYQREFTLYRSNSTLKPSGDNGKASLSSRLTRLDLSVTAEFDI